mmetsp:Transcript_6016/g.13168  ORF Transcript_6016/g.13168 Transcript_6016/m.13168 type:complete len:1097 (-) Transcript_6016:21-3311(-)
MLSLCHKFLALALLRTAVADSHGGEDGRFRLEAGQCHTECASGYASSSMTSHDVCDSMDHMFTLSGCEPICIRPATNEGYNVGSCITTGGAILASQCTVTCAAGYRWVSADTAPTASCSSGYGTFVFSGCEAEPTCTLPTGTAVEPYSTSGCTTTSGARREDQCTVTCNTPNYNGNAADSCPSGGGVFQLTGCEPACNLPSSTTGYTGCSNGQTASQCTPSCATDYTGTATDTCPTAGGDFVFSGCTALPKCKLGAASTYTGYTPTNCGTSANPVTIDTCGVTCASGWEPTTSGTAPVDSCANDDADFGFSGCSKIPQCSMSAQTGYVVSSCDTSGGNLWESQCGVSCAADYTGTPQATCSVDGQPFTVTGCSPIPTCSAPATTGYTLTGCDTTNGNLRASACNPSCDTANDYSGTASATCASMGAAMTFSGCHPECNLPSPMTGYTGTCTGSAPQRANQCGVTCAVGYMGTAVVTCNTPGTDFLLTGCTAVPTCELPASAVGYRWGLCNPGRGSTYGIPEAECSVACAPGYHGTAERSCSGGTFALSGCMPGEGCELPSSTLGYRTELCTLPECGDSNENQAYPIDAGSCGVECAVGYGGMNPSAMCDTAGGTFSLSGCEPLCVLPATYTGYNVGFCVTTAGAITAAQCSVSCASGYQMMSGMSATATCSTGFGYFSFSGCETPPTCSLPSTIPAAYSYSSGCTGPIVEGLCTGVTCASNYNGVASVSCPSSGTFVLSGCEPACTLPATTTGFSISGCTGSKSSAQCTVACDSWYIGTPMDSCATAGGEHILSGCTAEPKCKLPTNTDGYSPSGCGSTTSSVYDSQCSVSCATGYEGSSAKSCTGAADAEFVFSGCTAIPKCTAPATLTGYDFGGCSGQIYATDCAASCASNYAGSAVPTCSTNLGTFSFTGCEPTCSLPTTMPVGHLSGSCGAQRAATAVSACNVRCASGYALVSASEITATCPSAGGILAFSGCAQIPTCTLSANSHLGYDVSLCNPGDDRSYGIPESECTVSCATGYAGSAMATCSSTGSTFSLSGCEPVPQCTLPASTAGYEASRCVTSIDCSWNRVGGTVQQGVSAAAVLMAFLFYALQQ